jgi:Domain of unknown function (DUF4331)
VPRKVSLIKPAAAVAAATLLTSLGGFAATPVAASSHREAPAIAADPQVDATDLYAFMSPDKRGTVTLISNWGPFQEPAAGPTFHRFADDVRYDINVDNDGDAKADVIYRWTFGSGYRDPRTVLYNASQVTELDDPDLNFRQHYDLERISGGASQKLLDDAPVAPAHVGVASMPSYRKLREQAVQQAGGPERLSFAGPADDPYFADQRVFDRIYGGDLSEIGQDTFAGYNVSTIALQVPIRELVGAEPTIGVWTTAQRRSLRVLRDNGSQEAGGDWVQVSRLGNPLVNEVAIPAASRDLFNASKPEDDAQFLRAVNDPELPKLIQAAYRIPAPKAPRNDLVSVFLTGIQGLNRPRDVVPSEMLRLNTSIGPSRDGRRLGVVDGDTAGFPNGRRLGDDVVDIALQLFEGELVGTKNDLSDGVDASDAAPEKTFPYVALPHPCSGAGPHLPKGGVATGGGGTSRSMPLPAAAAAGIVLALSAATGTALVVRRRARPGA